MPNDDLMGFKRLDQTLQKVQWFFAGVSVCAIVMPILQHVLS